MAVHYFNFCFYRPVSALLAIEDLAAHHGIFIGDTNHHGQATQGALLEVFDSLAQRGLQRDVCVEFNESELAAEQAYSQLIWPVLNPGPNLGFNASKFYQHDLRDLSSIHPKKCEDAVLTSVAASYRFAIARQHRVNIHPVDFPDKKKDTHYGTRLARDAEVGANIKAVVQNRPFMCIYGSSHLRAKGIPAAFSGVPAANVFVYGNDKDLQNYMLEHTVALWAQPMVYSPPAYIYVGSSRTYYRHLLHQPRSATLS